MTRVDVLGRGGEWEALCGDFLSVRLSQCLLCARMCVSKNVGVSLHVCLYLIAYWRDFECISGWYKLRFILFIRSLLSNKV